LNYGVYVNYFPSNKVSLFSIHKCISYLRYEAAEAGENRLINNNYKFTVIMPILKQLLVIEEVCSWLPRWLNGWKGCNQKLTA